jgi:hypothetical protein
MAAQVSEVRVWQPVVLGVAGEPPIGAPGVDRAPAQSKQRVPVPSHQASDLTWHGTGPRGISRMPAPVRAGQSTPRRATRCGGSAELVEDVLQPQVVAAGVQRDGNFPV